MKEPIVIFDFLTYPIHFNIKFRKFSKQLAFVEWFILGYIHFGIACLLNLILSFANGLNSFNNNEITSKEGEFSRWGFCLGILLREDSAVEPEIHPFRIGITIFHSR